SETLHRQRLGRQHLVRYERPTTLKPRSLSLFVRLMDRAFKGSLEVAPFVYIRNDRRSVSPSLAKPEHAPSPELDGRVGSDALPVAAGYVDGTRPRTLSHAVRHVGVANPYLPHEAVAGSAEQRKGLAAHQGEPLQQALVYASKLAQGCVDLRRCEPRGAS